MRREPQSHRGEESIRKLALLEVRQEAVQDAAGGVPVTLRTSEGDIVSRLNEISLLDGVMSAALVFHHVEAAGDVASARED